MAAVTTPVTAMATVLHVLAVLFLLLLGRLLMVSGVIRLSGLAVPAAVAFVIVFMPHRSVAVAV